MEFEMPKSRVYILLDEKSALYVSRASIAYPAT